MKIDSADIAGIATSKFFVNLHQNLEIYPPSFCAVLPKTPGVKQKYFTKKRPSDEGLFGIT